MLASGDAVWHLKAIPGPDPGGDVMAMVLYQHRGQSLLWAAMGVSARASSLVLQCGTDGFWAGFCTIGDGLRLWNGEERNGGEQRTVAADKFFGDFCPQVSLCVSFRVT